MIEEKPKIIISIWEGQVSIVSAPIEMDLVVRDYDWGKQAQFDNEGNVQLDQDGDPYIEC